MIIDKEEKLITLEVQKSCLKERAFKNWIAINGVNDKNFLHGQKNLINSENVSFRTFFSNF